MSKTTTGVALACCLIGGNALFAQEDFPSEDLADLLDQLRPAVLGCPCPFKTMIHFAGWEGPVCDIRQNTPTQVQYVLYSRNDDGLDNSVPVAEITIDLDGGAQCTSVNDNSNAVAQKQNMSYEEFTACAADLNQLALSLGLPDGCSP